MDVVVYVKFIHPRQEVPLRVLSLYATNININWSQLHTKFASATAHLSAQYGEIRPMLPPSNINMISYMSLGIHDVQTQDQCMQMWRAALMKKIPGCVVSEMLDVTDVRGLSQIYERTQHAHEQQQAEKLRTTLTTHMTAPANVAPSKKL